MGDLYVNTKIFKQNIQDFCIQISGTVESTKYSNAHPSHFFPIHLFINGKWIFFNVFTIYSLT